MANPGDFAYTVKQQADIVRIVGDYVKLKKAGAQNFSGLCPFHSEKTPSFSVHATRQFYHCFGCGASGDVFSFVQKLENITFPEAVRLVAQKVGVPLPKAAFNTAAEAEDARLRTVLLDIHERACAWFQSQLRRPEAAHAREYLAGRGLKDENIALFRIGFAPESGFLLRDHLRGQFDEELLKASGLFSWKEHEEEQKSAKLALYSKFRNRIMFPIRNEAGKIIAFTGRTLDSNEKSGPKYLNSPETAIYSKSRVLFNLDLAKEAIRKLDYAVLVEGQMDCISVFVAGFHNVIASSGTAFTDSQARLLARFSKNIVVNFDPDTAGAAAAERSLGLLVAEDFQIKVMTLEAGFDPDLFVRHRGPQAYRDALNRSEKYFDYLIARSRALFSTKTAEGKVKAVNYLLPHIQRVPSRIARDELARETAQKLGIDSAILGQELRHAAASRAGAQVKTPTEPQVTDAERILIRALASLGAWSEQPHISSREGTDVDFDPARQARFTLLGERLHEGLATESLIEALLRTEDEALDPLLLPLSEADRQLLAGILMREEEELTPELLEGAMEALSRREMERQRRDLQRQILEAERKQDTVALNRLLKEKLELERALTAPLAGTRSKAS